jgi:hypothetical protein
MMRGKLISGCAARAMLMPARGLRAALLLVLALLLQACATAPPVQEMSDARQAIAAAREAGAGELAPATLLSAEESLAQAEQQLQNGIWWAARKSALSARENAFNALLESRNRRAADRPGGEP